MRYGSVYVMFCTSLTGPTAARGGNNPLLERRDQVETGQTTAHSAAGPGRVDCGYRMESDLLIFNGDVSCRAFDGPRSAARLERYRLRLVHMSRTAER